MTKQENMSAMDIFKQNQETFDEAKKKASSENGSRVNYLRFAKDGKYTVRVLPLAPIIESTGQITLPRKGYEYPTKEILLKIEDTKKDAKGKPKIHFISVCNAKYAFPNIPSDLIDTYVKVACELYADDTALCDKLKSGGFNGGLKYDSKRCMYVFDMDKRENGLQILQLTYSQYKELEERKLQAWEKLRSRNSAATCPISSVANAFAVEIIRKTDKKTEYSLNIDTLSEPDSLTESELQSLLDAPRLPEVLYRYTRFHLEASIAFLQQMDDKFNIDVVNTQEVQDCIDTIKMALPADDQSHFTLGSDDNKKGSNSIENALDNLWNQWELLSDKGEDDKSDGGRALRTSIKEFIEEYELNVAISRSKSNQDLLDEIESALRNSNEEKTDEDEDGEDEYEDKPSPTPAKQEIDDEDDDAPAADPIPQQRNDDTNEPAARPERRSARPERRRR